MDGIDANIFPGGSKHSRPVPDVAKQALVQGDGKAVGENVRPLPTKPAQAGHNIGLLQLIEFALRCDVLLLQSAKLVRVEWRRSFGISDIPDHVSRQKSDGMSRAISRVRRSTS